MNSKHHILILVLAGFFISGLYFYVRPIAEGGDTADYLLLAKNLVEHQSYSLRQESPFIPSIRRSPLYPVFIAIVTLGTNIEELVILAQIIIGILTVLVFYFIACQITSKFYAFAGSCFYLFYPARISSINTILTESVYTFLLLGAIYLTVLFVKTRKRIFIFSSGFVFGLASLCRPISISYALVLMFILLFTEYKSINEKLRNIALPFILMLVIVIIPWSIRNTVVSQQFVLFQATGAVNYYIPTRFDLNQSDEDKLWDIFYNEDYYGKKITDAIIPAEFLEADSTALNLAINNIKSNPMSYLVSRIKSYPHLLITSFDNFTGYNRSFTDTLIYKDYKALIVKLGLLFLFSLTPFIGAVIGLCRNIKNNLGLIISSVWLTTLLIHIPLWIEYRFWIPVFPILILSALTAIRIREKDL